MVEIRMSGVSRQGYSASAVRYGAARNMLSAARS
jgi:hypothetical protein